jgi:chaperone modulatory protein CbpM
MSMETREFLSAARIDVGMMTAWIEAGWLGPHCKSEEFLDIDVARARLIRDLTDIGVKDEGIPVILNLVDQLHGLRRALHEVVLAVRAQPETRRSRVSRPDSPY